MFLIYLLDIIQNAPTCLFLCNGLKCCWINESPPAETLLLQVLLIGCLTRFSAVRLSWNTSQLCRSFLKLAPMRTPPPPRPPQSRTTLKGPIVTCRFHSRWDAGFSALSFHAPVQHFHCCWFPGRVSSNRDLCYFLSLSSSCPVLLCHLLDERGRSTNLILTLAPQLITGNRLGRRLGTSHWAPHLVPQCGILQSCFHESVHPAQIQPPPPPLFCGRRTELTHTTH